MRKIITPLLILLVASCRPCDPEIIDNGPLSEQALGMVPYLDGEEYKFRHSNGLLINFHTIRQTSDDQTYCDWYCCDNLYRFQTDKTSLFPDYPIFDFNIEMSNMDTMVIDFYAWIGRCGFYIPSEDYHLTWAEIADSIMIDSILYYDVFMLKSDYGSVYDTDSIYADSMYYNYDYGILKILMSNEESYTIIR